MPKKTKKTQNRSAPTTNHSAPTNNQQLPPSQDDQEAIIQRLNDPNELSVSHLATSAGSFTCPPKDDVIEQYRGLINQMNDGDGSMQMVDSLREAWKKWEQMTVVSAKVKATAATCLLDAIKEALLIEQHVQSSLSESLKRLTKLFREGLTTIKTTITNNDPKKKNLNDSAKRQLVWVYVNDNLPRLLHLFSDDDIRKMVMPMAEKDHKKDHRLECAICEERFKGEDTENLDCGGICHIACLENHKKDWWAQKKREKPFKRWVSIQCSKCKLPVLAFKDMLELKDQNEAAQTLLILHNHYPDPPVQQSTAQRSTAEHSTAAAAAAAGEQTRNPLQSSSYTTPEPTGKLSSIVTTRSRSKSDSVVWQGLGLGLGLGLGSGSSNTSSKTTPESSTSKTTNESNNAGSVDRVIKRKKKRGGKYKLYGRDIGSNFYGRGTSSSPRVDATVGMVPIALDPHFAYLGYLLDYYGEDDHLRPETVDENSFLGCRDEILKSILTSQEIAALKETPIYKLDIPIVNAIIWRIKRTHNDRPTPTTKDALVVYVALEACTFHVWAGSSYIFRCMSEDVTVEPHLDAMALFKTIEPFCHHCKIGDTLVLHEDTLHRVQGCKLLMQGLYTTGELDTVQMLNVVPHETFSGIFSGKTPFFTVHILQMLSFYSIFYRFYPSDAFGRSRRCR